MHEINLSYSPQVRDKLPPFFLTRKNFASIRAGLRELGIASLAKASSCSSQEVCIPVTDGLDWPVLTNEKHP